MSRSRRALRSAVAPAAFASALVIISLLDYCQVDAFRISFDHRIVKSAQQHSNPQLNPPDTLIRPIECRNANNRSETGICMFSIDCMQNKGVPLSVCKHNYFVGTCCKLPDHNNFVGIVYDLRETETANQQLEARRSAASGQLVAGPPANATQPLLIKQAAPTAIAGDEDEQRQVSGHKSTSTATSSGPSQTSDSNDRSSPATSATIKSHLERRSTVSQPSESPGETSPANLATTPTGAPPTIQTTPASPSAQLAEKLLDEKYIISSTKLFQSPSSVASSSTSTTASPLQQAPSVVLFPSSSITVETARNSDGSSQAGNSQQQQQHGPQNGSIAAHVAYEGASGELRDSPVLSSGVYEILAAGEKSDESSAPSFHQNVSDLSQGTLLSSAHSAPGRLNSQQSSVYLLADETDSAQKNVPTSIVFSSNHQQQAGEPPRHQQQQQQTSSPAPPFSDQEFALSTSGGAQEAGSSSISSLVYSSTLASQPSTASQATGPPTSPDGTLASSPASPSSLSLTSAGGSADSSSPSHQAYLATSSPYVDLVSSQHHSTSQTTTPFTSSLSTAILPNISSHPYAPTTLAPASSPASQALVSSTSSVGSNKQPQPQLPAGQDVSSFAPLHSSVSPLFYSTSSQAAHSSTSTRGDSDAAAAAGHSPAHSSRPGGSAGLQAASKIVTSNSASNNLIPGLSGLQSAILSHIPFKIASGLSSGLTSYLQAAMKPTSGHNRPLISSNTAPALQYQQQQQHSNATSANHANNKLVASAVVQPSVQQGAVRFPAPASASTTSSSSGSVPAPPAAERDVLREAQLVCGKPQVSPHEVLKKRVARIVGGNQSSFGQWPWMVSLRQWRKGAFLHKCGAALLNENWAITAAHCVENVKAPDLLLRLGEFDVSNQNEPYPYTERRVKSVVSHPSFDPKTFEYDLALIRFTEPVQYERNIVPVCVPAGNDSFVDRMATVIGWGRLYEDGPLPDVIQHVNVPIITNQECEKMYKNAGFVEEIPDMFICAGISKGGRDSCEGDSGGPLTMIDHDGRSYLVGIISWGIGCALPSQPGVYTRITAFSPWINSILST